MLSNHFMDPGRIIRCLPSAPHACRNEPLFIPALGSAPTPYAHRLGRPVHGELEHATLATWCDKLEVLRCLSISQW